MKKHTVTVKYSPEHVNCARGFARVLKKLGHDVKIVAGETVKEAVTIILNQPGVPR